jgi:outer membrane autotransporter protein
VNYSNTKISDYGERGSTGVELKYDDQWINSLQSVLGVQGSAAFSTGLGVLVPQFNADYIHEFANSQRFINVRFAEDFRATPTKFTFQNDVPVRNYFNLGTGLMMVLPNGWQPFVNFRAMVGNEQFNNYAGMFGLRIEL